MPNNQLQPYSPQDLLSMAFMISMHLALADSDEPAEQKKLEEEPFNWPAFVNKRTFSITLVSSLMLIGICLNIRHLWKLFSNDRSNAEKLNIFFGKNIGIQWHYKFATYPYAEIADKHVIKFSNSEQDNDVNNIKLTIKRENLILELVKALLKIKLLLVTDRNVIRVLIPEGFDWPSSKYLSRISNLLRKVIIQNAKKKFHLIKPVNNIKNFAKQQSSKKDENDSRKKISEKEFLLNKLNILSEKVAKLKPERLSDAEQNHLLDVLAQSTAKANQPGQIGKFAHDLKEFAENKSLEWEKNRKVIDKKLLILQNLKANLTDNHPTLSLETLSESIQLADTKLIKFTEYVKNYRENFNKGFDKLAVLQHKLNISLEKDKGKLKSIISPKLKTSNMSDKNSLSTMKLIEKKSKTKFDNNNNNAKELDSAATGMAPAIEKVNLPVTTTSKTEMRNLVQVCWVSSNNSTLFATNKHNIQTRQLDAEHDWRHLFLESFRPIMPLDNDDVNHSNKDPIVKYTLHYYMLKIFAKARFFAKTFNFEIDALDKAQFVRCTNLIFDYQATSILTNSIWKSFTDYLLKDFSEEEKNNPKLVSIEKLKTCVTKDSLWIAFHQGVLHNDKILINLENKFFTPRNNDSDKIIHAIEIFRLIAEPIKNDVDLNTYSDRGPALEMLLASIGFYCWQIKNYNTALLQKLSLITNRLVNKLIRFKDELVFVVHAEEGINKERLFYFKQQIDQVDLAALKDAKLINDFSSIFVTPALQQRTTELNAHELTAKNAANQMKFGPG